MLEGEDGHLFGMGYGKRPKNEPVDDAKDRGIGGHAEGESNDADEGEAGVLGESAKGVLSVFQEIEHVGELSNPKYWICTRIPRA